jgi:hypothetical protein
MQDKSRSRQAGADGSGFFVFVMEGFFYLTGMSVAGVVGFFDTTTTRELGLLFLLKCEYMKGAPLMRPAARKPHRHDHRNETYRNLVHGGVPWQE